MNLRLIAMLGAGLAGSLAHAAVFDLDLGPASESGAGMHPGNTAGNVSSGASGGELNTRDPLKAGISYDDENHVLSINIGWGNTYGFTDLQGTPSLLEIGGPVSVPRTEGNSLYNLYSFHPGFFGESTRDGFFTGTLQLEKDPSGSAYSIEAQEADLRAGLWYLNLRTTAYPGGEIRGQLIPVPEPETYAMCAGLGLLGFAMYRRWAGRARQFPTRGC